MALVTLFDSGPAVGATCPIKGLVEGNGLTILQYPGSTFVVTGKL